MRFALTLAVAALAVCSLPSRPGHAASFDCKAAQQTKRCPEVTICATPKLSKADDDLAAAYELARKQLGEARVKTSQTAWLSARNSCGCDAGCLEISYERRLSDLAKFTAADRAGLKVGYDDEGKVDASAASCLAFVKETTEWSEAETRSAAQKVCEARKRHVDAYAKLQASYRAWLSVFSEDRRIDYVEAAKHMTTLVKACIDHKMNLTTGGHNIAIDIIPNEITATCLVQGARMLDEEAANIGRPWIPGKR
jgi:uncharacterized protein